MGLTEYVVPKDEDKIQSQKCCASQIKTGLHSYTMSQTFRSFNDFVINQQGYFFVWPSCKPWANG
jgi:hypothetical protein